MMSTSVSSAAAHATWSAAGTSHAVFGVDGMRCAACSGAITRAVAAVHGVLRVSVNVATARASVDWAPDQVSLRQILEVVSKTGFKPVPLAGEPAAVTQRGERRTALKRIGLAGLGMMQTMMFVYCLYAPGTHGIDPGIAQYLKLAGLLITTPVLVYSGAPFFLGAWRELRRRAFGMDVPVAIALALAYGASVVNTLRGSGEIYFDSVTMFIFLLLSARFIELSVRHHKLSATEALARSLPATVTRVLPDGGSERVPPERIEPDDLIVVPKGAVIPVDAKLVDAAAEVDESLLTGESVPVGKTRDERVLGGSINIGHPIRVVAAARSSQSMLANIVGLLERTQSAQAPAARLADRVASYFILTTLVLAALTTLAWLSIEPARALPAALAVLVVTCPCALSLATPVAIAAATTRLARRGLLVTRADALEKLAAVNTVLIDKTGTLTRGLPHASVEAVAAGYSRTEVLEIAASLESGSGHPLASAFRGRARAVDALKEFAGEGVEGCIEGVSWRLGTVEFVGHGLPGSQLVLGNAAGWAASFRIQDALRPGAAEAVKRLQDLGLEVAIASGDQDSVVRSVAGQLGIREAMGHLTPERKLAIVQSRQAAGERVLMVGDGINDGPVLAEASVSCAMGGGSAVAQAAADLLLMNESLGVLAEAVDTARRMRSIIRQNLSWGVLYNLAAVPLAALGWIAPWVAALGMSCSSLLVVLNAARLARAPERP